ncbi:MAG TPA: flagellar basal body-associated FliL family protein [Xanthobacteraceae bacterium]|jgi:flagellar FliL protein
MAGEILNDLEFVEPARAPARQMRAKLVVPVSIALLALAVGVAYIAVTAREKRTMTNTITAPAPLFLDLPAIAVNLSTADERPRTLKLSLSLEAADSAAAKAVQAALPYLLDSFQTYLRELRAAEIEGSAGIFRLREELMKRVNLAIAPSLVRAVLVRDIILQ